MEILEKKFEQKCQQLETVQADNKNLELQVEQLKHEQVVCVVQKSTVTLGYNIIEGTVLIVSLEISVTVSDLCGKSKERDLKTKYKPEGILLKCLCFGTRMFKMQLFLIHSLQMH